MVRTDLIHLCAAHGIEPDYCGMDGVTRAVPAETLGALASALRIETTTAPAPSTIADVRGEPRPRRCHVPGALLESRVWGITCQLPSLVSARNLGMGDFADLEALCGVAAAEGADFVGVNPLHALFWSDPGTFSPFSPSNRRFLSPLYVALDRVNGFIGLTGEEEVEAAHARAAPLVDYPAVARLKDRVLRRLFAHFQNTNADRPDFDAFCATGGGPLMAHATFEAISEAAVAAGAGAKPPAWPKRFQRSASPHVVTFADENRAAVDYHRWLQWLAHRQLARVQGEARRMGLRVGLYLDVAVGAVADGSEAWTDPTIVLPELSIGAPPDWFNASGQDWGLAPLSPVRLAELDGRPLADLLSAVMANGGAVRIDHAMGLARQWLVPLGARPYQGAYVRYPLSQLLARLSDVSQGAGALVVGEDLGLVPLGFRELMAERLIHSYRVFFAERDGAGFIEPRWWPRDALACIGTHDMPTFAGWWHESDIDTRESLGLLRADGALAARAERRRERAALRAVAGGTDDPLAASAALHAHVAASPCRLAALQLEDALGLRGQVNVPGTVSEYPNWRRRLPFSVDTLAMNPAFRAHADAMRAARPR